MYNYTTEFKGMKYKYEKLCISNGVDVDEEIDVFYTITSASPTSYFGVIINEGEMIFKRTYNEEW